MPAITVDDITVLPRIPEPDPTVARSARQEPDRSRRHGLEGEGFPVRRAFAGVDLADLDPFVHLDQMGEVEYAPGEPKGTPWHPHRGFETVTYMIDGTFEHQRLERRRRGDHERRHPVDDRRRRHPPHREAAGGARRRAAACSTASSSGSTCRRPRSGPAPRYQDLRAAEVALLSSSRRRSARPGHRRRGRRPPGPGLDLHADDARPRDAQPGRPPVDPVARRLQRARLRPGGPSARSAAEERPIQMGQLAVFGAGNALTIDGRSRPGAVAARISTSCSSAADRSASPSPGWARS